MTTRALLGLFLVLLAFATATRAAAAEAAAATASARAHRGGLAEELRDAASARRAIILREVLGTPVGLR